MQVLTAIRLSGRREVWRGSPTDRGFGRVFFKSFRCRSGIVRGRSGFGRQSFGVHSNFFLIF